MTGNRVVPMLALLAAVVVAACDSSGATGPDAPGGSTPVAAVDVTVPSPTLLVGAQMTLVATPKSAVGEVLQRPVTWSSNNEQIATVNNAGLVTAIAPGPVNIVASSESRTGVAPITVTVVPPDTSTAVVEVRLSEDNEVLLEWDGSKQLSAVALDAQGAELPGRAVQWLTSRPDVATVTENGSVQAVGPGIATISAVIEGAVAGVGVRVRQAPVAEVLLDIPSAARALEVGETVFVGTRVKLVSGQVIESALTWTSSNPAIATASSSANVAAAIEALGVGDVTLTASVGGKSASVTLRIASKPTHDLIYNRWNNQGQSEIFVLSLGAALSDPALLNAGNASREPSPSPDGTQFVFAVSQVDPLGQQQHDLFVVNRNGHNMRWLTRMPGLEDEPAWSPDGTKIVFRGIDEAGMEHALWSINVDGTGLTKLTDGLPAGVSDPAHPAWSPDGSRIAFTATRDHEQKVWTMNADGSNAAQLTTDFGFDMTPTWAPTGDRIAFSRYENATSLNGWDVMIVSVAGGGTPARLALPGDQLVPAWSPDGQFIAVTGTAEAGHGRQNIYTLRPDGTGLRQRTGITAGAGATAPAWITRQ